VAAASLRPAGGKWSSCYVAKRYFAQWQGIARGNRWGRCLVTACRGVASASAEASDGQVLRHYNAGGVYE